MTRRYDDPVDVRRRDEDPAEFLWRGRHYAVREVLAHWVETGAWWVPREAATGRGGRVDRTSRHREVWRVAAARGRAVASVDDPGSGIFDLAFDWGEGVWRLAASAE